MVDRPALTELTQNSCLLHEWRQAANTLLLIWVHLHKIPPQWTPSCSFYTKVRLLSAYVMLQLNMSVFLEDFEWGSVWTLLMWTSVYVDSNRVVMCDDLSQLFCIITNKLPTWAHLISSDSIMLVFSCCLDASKSLWRRQLTATGLRPGSSQLWPKYHIYLLPS